MICNDAKRERKKSKQKIYNMDFFCCCLLSTVCVVYIVVSQNIYVHCVPLHCNVMWCSYWYTSLIHAPNACVSLRTSNQFDINELNRFVTQFDSTYRKINDSNLCIVLNIHFFVPMIFVSLFMRNKNHMDWNCNVASRIQYDIICH